MLFPGPSQTHITAIGMERSLMGLLLILLRSGPSGDYAEGRQDAGSFLVVTLVGHGLGQSLRYDVVLG